MKILHDLQWRSGFSGIRSLERWIERVGRTDHMSAALEKVITKPERISVWSHASKGTAPHRPRAALLVVGNLGC